LREREGDAVLLANHFLHRYSADRAGPPLRFGPDALAAINLHSWPGNVRELENRVKRAVIMADGTSITAADLDLADNPEAGLQTLREARMMSDRRTITAALTAASGSISRAAKLLGISRPTLYDMIRELDIQAS
jgi:two-component system NtrC family response regulator